MIVPNWTLGGLASNVEAVPATPGTSVKAAMGDWSGVMATASPEPGVPIWRNRDEVEGGAGGVVQLDTVLSVQ